MLFMTASLTGLPPESRGPSSKDMSIRLSEVLEGTRKVMKDVHQDLWPEVVPVPEDMAALAEQLKRAQCQIQAWKVSSCREGAREAWAMVKTHYTGLKTTELAEMGPMGPGGEEIPTSQAYDSVMPAACLSQKDCLLDILIDGLDRA